MSAKRIIITIADEDKLWLGGYAKASGRKGMVWLIKERCAQNGNDFFMTFLVEEMKITYDTKWMCCAFSSATPLSKR